VENLTPTQSQMLNDLKHLGIIYQRKVMISPYLKREKQKKKILESYMYNLIFNSSFFIFLFFFFLFDLLKFIRNLRDDFILHD